MNKRENLLWQIILIVALFSIVYNGYTLYNMNAKSVDLWENFEKEEIGTDKKLQNKVERLEQSLQNNKDFKFKMKKNPSELSSVIDFAGLNSMGVFRHFKLENIWYSKKREKFMAQLSTPRGSNFYSVADTLSGGIIIEISEKWVIFEKDGDQFRYELNM